MNKVLLNTSDIEFLLRWRDEHKDLVRIGVNPMKAIKIICADSGYAITGIRNGSQIKLTVNEKGLSIGSMTFGLMANGMFKLIVNKTKLGMEDQQAVLTVYCSVMALLVFGNKTVDLPQDNERKKIRPPTKPSKTPKKSKRKGVTYILSRSGNELQMMAQGSHSSPNGTFSVRGHYRHYKSGKVIWIEEYTKGNGKKKNKTYKVGLKGETK